MIPVITKINGKMYASDNIYIAIVDGPSDGKRFRLLSKDYIPFIQNDGCISFCLADTSYDSPIDMYGFYDNEVILEPEHIGIYE